MTDKTPTELRRNRSGELHIRNLDLVTRLKAQAEKQSRTNNAQACLYIANGLAHDEAGTRPPGRPRIKGHRP